MPDEEELDSLDPGYDGAKGRYYLRSIFGSEFCHEMMADFDLPTCHDEINWDDEKCKTRWMHFCVAFIPVYLADGAEMVREHPEHAEAHALMCHYYEAAQVGLREALRHDDPDGFALYHPGDAMPEWLREVKEPPHAEALVNFSEGLDQFIAPIEGWNTPDENGEYEWRLGWLFWADFEHEAMPNFDLPPTYNQINWREPRQTRNWLRFCGWFLPQIVDYTGRKLGPMSPQSRETVLLNFQKIAEVLDNALPREEGEAPLFEA